MCVEAPIVDLSTCGEVGAAAGLRQPGPCLRKSGRPEVVCPG